MNNPFDDDDGEFFVVVNDERQYSIWPTFRPIPDGWIAVGTSRKRPDCLRWIEAHWTDMRPHSLVQAMEHAAAPEASGERAQVRGVVGVTGFGASSDADH